MTELFGTLPVTNPNAPNSCSLAPGFLCAAGNPPLFLLGVGVAEGPSGAGGQTECNRQTVACSTGTIPGAGHSGHPSGDNQGVYSYLALSTIPLCSDAPFQQHLSFLSGEYTLTQQPYVCNDCPPLGHGKQDGTSPATLRSTGAAASVQMTGLSLWGTQMGISFLGGSFATGHIRLGLDQGGPGKMSYCGTGTVHQDLLWDNCEENPDPATVDFGYHHRLALKTYSLITPPGTSTDCEPADCYVKRVIMPAAFAQDSNAITVQVLQGTARVPSSAHCLFANSTLDVLIYAFSTQQIDIDGDGTRDAIDPCPNDPADACLLDLIGGGSCPGGTVFCEDGQGTAGCFQPALCSTFRDVNQSCAVSTSDVIDVFASDFFNVPVPIGPFEP